MSLRIGDLVDDFTLVQADGQAVHLHDFPARPLLLIFLRHLA